MYLKSVSTTVSFPVLRMLDAGEVRAIKAQTTSSGRKQEFLRAIVGSMSEQEATDLERRVHQTAEWVDGDGQAPS